ncbi:MAG TPA: hypothetical protein VFP70_09120 [Burkholderiales bacterium]|nr:hypothetical protein [Burkholderiales bacterium]
MSGVQIHLALAERIAARYPERLAAGPRLSQDALVVQFADGLALELRFASAQEYSIRWVWGEAELGIDTAPLHPGLSTFPNHLHDHEGACRADPLTVPGRDPWENLERLLQALLADPLLEGVAA